MFQKERLTLKDFPTMTTAGMYLLVVWMIEKSLPVGVYKQRQLIPRCLGGGWLCQGQEVQMFDTVARVSQCVLVV